MQKLIPGNRVYWAGTCKEIRSIRQDPTATDEFNLIVGDNTYWIKINDQGCIRTGKQEVFLANTENYEKLSAMGFTLDVPMDYSNRSNMF